MIEQLAGTLNLSSTARAYSAALRQVDDTPAWLRAESVEAMPSGVAHPVSDGDAAGREEKVAAALPVISTLVAAANENGAEDGAARLAARALAREKARAKRQLRQRAERRRWLALMVLALLLVTALQVFATPLVRLLPGMAQVYAALGVPVDVPGWRLREWRVQWSTGADGAPELLLRGRAVNASGRTLPMPRIGLELLDGNGTVLYRWRIPVRHDHVVKAGGEARFRSRLAQVPVEAVSVRLGIVHPVPSGAAARVPAVAQRDSGTLELPARR